jgi:AcrR family transcriptional regulator
MSGTGVRRAGEAGLRERKKRAMRQQLSDTATAMFLERGFESVRVADVAEACNVSEKTVFNYFPSKEALLLDRLEAMAEALHLHLADVSLTPVAAMLRILDGELAGLDATLAAAPDHDQALTTYRRFGDLIRETPSLRAYRSDMADRYVDVAAEALASRAGLQRTDPEPQIAAAALVGLWRIQFHGLRTHLRPGHPIPEAIATVTGQVHRAASLIESGLATFPASTNRDQ